MSSARRGDPSYGRDDKYHVGTRLVADDSYLQLRHKAFIGTFMFLVPARIAAVTEEIPMQTNMATELSLHWVISWKQQKPGTQ